MEGKVVVEAVLEGKKSTFPEDMEEKDAMAAAAAYAAAIFAFLASPLSLLRHVARLYAGYLGLVDGSLKPSAPAPASSSSSSSSAAAAGCQQDDEVVEAAASEDCTDVVLEVRSRGFTRPTTRSLPKQSKAGEAGGVKN